jgi:hypothetical protein
MNNDDPTNKQPHAHPRTQEAQVRAELWRVAEGRLGWPLLTAGLLPLALIFFGLVFRIHEYGLKGFLGQDPSSYFVLMGMGLFGLSLWQTNQRQLGALREIVKSLERP